VRRVAIISSKICVGSVDPQVKTYQLGIVVTISGLHGTGKSTYARVLAGKFGLRHVSAGTLFRQIAAERGVSLTELSRLAATREELDRLVDEQTKKAAAQGNAIIDGLLAGWMAGDQANIKVFLIASDRVRFRRIARREKVPYEDAERATVTREDYERRRFKRYYNLEIEDRSIYDVVLNTELLPVNATIAVLWKLISEYTALRGGERR
jgi:cytidylate kinase